MKEIRRVAIDCKFEFEMTEQEAAMLLSVLARVSGSTQGPRGVFAHIFEVLTNSLGYDFNQARELYPHYLSGTLDMREAA